MTWANWLGALPSMQNNLITSVTIEIDDETTSKSLLLFLFMAVLMRQRCFLSPFI